MPAPEKSRVGKALPDRVALIAGSGALPARLLKACDAKGINVFVVGFDGQTDPALFDGRDHLITRMGAAGTIIQTLKQRHIHDMVFLGAVRRPSLAEMMPDIRTTAFFLKLGLKALGDDGLLQAMRRELESEGFRIHGLQAFMQDALTPEGPLGRYKPGKAEWHDIAFGASVISALGQLDIGQSVIVQEGLVLGVEAIEGTDELIRRCVRYKRKGQGPILVKSAKPQQDRDLDLPTIGPETVQLCADAGMAGIAVGAGQSLTLDRDVCAALADRYKMFVVGADFSALGESHGD